MEALAYNSLPVISKEMVGNSWDILNAILGHESSESLSQGDI